MKNVLVNGRSGRASCHRIITELREFYKDGDVIPWEDLEYFIEQLCGLDWRTKMKYVASLVKLKFLEPIGPRRRIIIRKPGRMGHVRTYERLGAWEAYKFGAAAPRRYQETLNPKYVPPPSPSPLLKKMKDVEENYVRVVVGGEVGEEVGGSRAEGGEGENRRKEEKKGQRTHNLLSQEKSWDKREEEKPKIDLVHKNKPFSGHTELSQERLSQEKRLERLENEKQRIEQTLKLKDLKGSVVWEKVDCRSPPRRCCPHGPYAYLHYYDSRSGKVRRKYLGKNVELLTCSKTELQEKLRSLEDEQKLILGTRKGTLKMEFLGQERRLKMRASSRGG